MERYAGRNILEDTGVLGGWTGSGGRETYSLTLLFLKFDYVGPWVE